MLSDILDLLREIRDTLHAVHRLLKKLAERAAETRKRLDAQTPGVAQSKWPPAPGTRAPDAQTPTTGFSFRKEAAPGEMVFGHMDARGVFHAAPVQALLARTPGLRPVYVSVDKDGHIQVFPVPPGGVSNGFLSENPVAGAAAPIDLPWR